MSSKSEYPSKYGTPLLITRENVIRPSKRLVTAAQWLGEFMCERRADRQKKSLHLQFWKTKPWDTIYRLQVIAANRLLKRLPTDTGMKAIMRFLRSPKGKTVYSLMGPF